MLLWYAIFKNDPRDASCTEERMPRPMVLRRFEHATALRMHDGRAVTGMWLIDSATREADVIAIHGSVSESIRARYSDYLRLKEKSPAG